MTPAGSPCGPQVDQETEQFEPGFLSERAEGGDRVFLVHNRPAPFNDSTIIKIGMSLPFRQGTFSRNFETMR